MAIIFSAAAVILFGAIAPVAAGPPALSHPRPARGMLLVDEYYCDNSKTVSLKIRQGLGVIEVLSISVGNVIVDEASIANLNLWIQRNFMTLTSSYVACETNGAVFYFKGTGGTRGQTTELEARWTEGGMQRLR